jgi:RNA polymerase sigma factor (sigma-70 family)
MELSEHLFRRESGRLVSALVRIFGVHNLALAEDVVQDAFCRALEVWKARGVPDNPAGWLMSVARNRALDIVRKEKTARTFAPELSRVLESEWTLAPTIEEAFTGSTIRDEQLRMMFSCCNPQLPEEVQVALVLNILCGFGASEVANAFLTSRAAMEKRISRGKKSLAASQRLFDLSDAEFGARLSTVLQALYLLFNEGYHGASAESTVRSELCNEAIRLAMLLLESTQTASPETYALAALMCLDAAKLPARLDSAGDLNPLLEQDRSRWDTQLVEQGLALLDRSTFGSVVSAYHVEAAIAAVHATARSVEETNWDAIVDLYDRLMDIAPSPIVALNRGIAIGQRDGPEQGLDSIRAIADVDRLNRYPFYPAAMGELELRLGNLAAANRHFAAAAALARSGAERRFLEKRVRDVADAFQRDGEDTPSNDPARQGVT